MIELLSPAEMAAADRLTIEGGIRGIDLMERAGLAVADAVTSRHETGTPVTVVAGPGNNGGDGFVAARILAGRGHRVRLLLVGDRAKLEGDAAEAASRWTGAVDAARPDALAGVIIDALFGAGLDRPAEGIARTMIEAMNAAGRVTSVDLPSGINGTTGAAMGAAVRADTSVTFFRRKPGHVLLPGRAHCGTVRVADIGIGAGTLATIRPRTFANAPALWGGTFPVPGPEGHKYSRGHAVVVSGGLASTGAARLAARAALRAGAGLVTIASPRDALAVNAAASLAVMVRPIGDAAELELFLADRRFNAIVVGPGTGVGSATRALVRTALAGERGAVLDADALTSFADDPEGLLGLLRGRQAPTVLTPHQGEFIRLFNKIVQSYEQKGKLADSKAAAERTGAVILLKGADTIIASPDGLAAVNENAPPWLATAGAGDVLAGLVAGLLAQGMPAFEAAAAAAWLQGEAARMAGPGLIAEDLSEVLPAVYARLFGDPDFSVRRWPRWNPPSERLGSD